MASEAYLNALKNIPQDIQDEVVSSLHIANEIHLILEEKNLRPADLAKMLNKSESEISKWLTGLHNFTLKTITKIEKALDRQILVPYSLKILGYEKKINELTEELEKMKSTEGTIYHGLFRVQESFSFSSIAMTTVVKNEVEEYLADFIISGYKDAVEITPETSSVLKISKQIMNANNDC
ncbi:helix-turn-helix domain-containing protein [Flagellimonas hadalis]|uniref:Helix-turn-helix transcriptional regulator n=1 Tax=Flagellimonas hadalis TaxID=2597517 RepID=A0A5N5IVB8_9FLAO|nr:helix-turn-helix transcriptional regulator [Allomuricauda hadalis]KAB5491745.1 helix-turn-helix transcriptional regulator [Allomuricauda hadalis]